MNQKWDSKKCKIPVFSFNYKTNVHQMSLFHFFHIFLWEITGMLLGLQLFTNNWYDFAGPTFLQNPAQPAAAEKRHRRSGHSCRRRHLWHFQQWPPGQIRGEDQSTTLHKPREEALWATVSEMTFAACVLSGGAGPAGDRRGQLPDRVWEEVGEGAGHQSPSSYHSV